MAPEETERRPGLPEPRESPPQAAAGLEHPAGSSDDVETSPLTNASSANSRRSLSEPKTPDPTTGSDDAETTPPTDASYPKAASSATLLSESKTPSPLLEHEKLSWSPRMSPGWLCCHCDEDQRTSPVVNLKKYRQCAKCPHTRCHLCSPPPSPADETQWAVENTWLPALLPAEGERWPSPGWGNVGWGQPPVDCTVGTFRSAAYHRRLPIKLTLLSFELTGPRRLSAETLRRQRRAPRGVREKLPIKVGCATAT